MIDFESPRRAIEIAAEGSARAGQRGGRARTSELTGGDHYTPSAKLIASISAPPRAMLAVGPSRSAPA